MLKRCASTVIVLFVLAGVSPAFAFALQQGPQTRPAPGGGQGGGRPGQQPGGNRPGGSNPGGGNRPGGGSNPGGNPPGGNPGGTPQQPSRPGNNRPRPSGGNRPNPNPGLHRPSGPSGPSRPSGGSHGRPPQWGHAPQNRPSYSFRPNDRNYLRNYYRRNLGYINRGRRPHLVMGGFFPYAYISYLTPVPAGLYGYLPPPPPGYQMGYYDGYVVIYDPLTYFIANVIDLLD